MTEFENKPHPEPPDYPSRPAGRSASTAELTKAMLAVMKAVPYVQKTGKMTGGGQAYTFASEAEFIARLRPALVEHGVRVCPVGQRIVKTENYVSARGAPMHRVLVATRFRFTHASGEWEEVETLGEGTDSGDKGANKAMTGALKYALRQAFCVETGDDPDAVSSDVQAAPAYDEKKFAERKAGIVRVVTRANLKKWRDIYRADPAMSPEHKRSLDALAAEVEKKIAAAEKAADEAKAPAK